MFEVLAMRPELDGFSKTLHAALADARLESGHSSAVLTEELRTVERLLLLL